MTAGDVPQDLPLVSVVIPTRDRKRRLLLALRSVLAQEAVDLEVIVVDDGSTDGTDEAVADCGDLRIRLVRHNTPRGESGARNRGLAEARGSWVAFLDDDDLWAPDKLSLQLSALMESGRDWAYAGDVVVDGDLRILYGAPPDGPDEVAARLDRYNAVPSGASNVIASRRALAEAGEFDVGLKRTADWDMWIRLARLGPPAWVCRPLVANCVHGHNMFRDMPAMFGELDTLANRYRIRVDRAKHYRWAAWEAQREGDRWRALRYYAGAVRRGDLQSIGRAAVALCRTGVASRRPGPADAWTAAAHEWLADLATTAESALHSSNGHQ